MVMRPRKARPSTDCTASHNSCTCLGRDSGLGGFPRGIDLEEDFERAAQTLGLRAEGSGEAEGVNGMNDVKELGGLRGLISLQVTDQVPSHRSDRARLLVRSLLHVVLTQVGETGLDRLLDARCVNDFRDRDQANLIGLASGSFGRGGDSFPRAGEVGEKINRGGSVIATLSSSRC